MSNPWVEHIKEFAKKTGKSYGCALSDPACKSSYKTKKETPVKSKQYNKQDHLNAIKEFREEKYFNSLDSETTINTNKKTLAEIQKDRLEASKYEKQISSAKRRAVKKLLNSQTIIEPKTTPPPSVPSNEYFDFSKVRKKKSGVIL